MAAPGIHRPSPVRIEPPRPPDVPAARRFPLIATIAPIVASVVLFAVTRSAFTLVFALLGPVVAVATVADSALNRRRAGRLEERRVEAELRRARDEIEQAHAAERAELDRQRPSALASIGLASVALAVGWTTEAREPVSAAVRLGRGAGSSAVTLGPAASIATDPRLSELRTDAARLRGAPVEMDATHGVVITGPRVLVGGLARGITLQLLARLSPDAARITAPPGEAWDWMADLPHPLDRTAPEGSVRITGSGLDITIAEGCAETELRGGPTAIVVLGDGTGRVQMGVAPAVDFVPDFVSLESAGAAALVLRDLAERSGRPVARELAETIDFAGLDHLSGPGLAAGIGVGLDGTLVVDLVHDGPHAVVGGTTGSGKSELLVTWVLAMAAQRPPDAVTFLFVDFKGGAAFDPLLPLPHCVGLITDLDAEQSLRALSSLGAEIRRRERTLAALGLRSIDDAAVGVALPRLVVVVDEYAALVETHSSLHAMFADIAARGRSLGVHLILCTQRPAGVMRDSILANCALRISLRVMSAADSTAVLGTDAAAALPARPAGRALVGAPGQAPAEFQVARSDADDIRRVADRWRGAQRPAAPWLPPLATHVELTWPTDRVIDDGIPFAVADRPAHQAQDEVSYRPGEHGSLLIVGGARSGKSGVLAALATGPTSIIVRRLPRELPQLWDELDPDRAVAAHAPNEQRLLLIDDLDAIVAGCDENYRPALLDRLVTLLREGSTSGIHLVITVQRVTGALQQLVALCGSMLVLRMPSRQEYVLAGGAASDFSDRLPPGGGHWRGERVQVYAVTPPATRDEVSVVEPFAVELDLARAEVAVVSTRPQRIAERIRELAPLRHVVLIGQARFGEVQTAGDAGLEVHAGGLPDILVADPETWQSQWSLLTAAQRDGDMLLEGCSLAEVRAITRSRELPPPCARGERAQWLQKRDGELVRARLPERPSDP